MFAKILLSVLAFVVAVQAATNPYDVTAVKNVMIKNAKASWEFGTAAEALLELDNADFSVFGSRPFATASVGIEALTYAKSHITLGGNLLIANKASNSDPASLGVSAVMLGKSYSSYEVAAEKQSDTLLYNTPRASNGAISHRSGSVSLWSDYIYMVPPFLAYYAATINNSTLLEIAVQQCEDYRAILKSSSGAWKHISASSHPDAGLWSTGNGWAAMGMTRVLATIIKMPSSTAQLAQAAKLEAWIKEIIDAAIATPRDSSNLLYNYLGDTATFGETSGTSLLAAVAYRMAVISPRTFGASYLKWANVSLAAIAKHVGSTGILSPAVDPYAYSSKTPYTVGSPEGQAFAVMLYAAHRDCIAASVCSG